MLIDTHCHIDRYPDPGSLVAVCEAEEIFTVAVSNLPSHYEMAVNHLSGVKYVRPALGFHPLAVSGNLHELPNFVDQLTNTEFVGEVGLDYSKQGVGSKAEQIEAFRTIAESLSRMPKVTTLHSRKSASELLDILDEFSVKPVVFHWFSDPASVLRRAIAAGHYFSINTSMISSKSGQAVITTVPHDRLLTETDGPYIKVGRRTVIPSDVDIVLEGIARLWHTEKQSVADKVKANFSSLCETFSIGVPK